MAKYAAEGQQMKYIRAAAGRPSARAQGVALALSRAEEASAAARVAGRPKIVRAGCRQRAWRRNGTRAGDIACAPPSPAMKY